MTTNAEPAKTETEATSSQEDEFELTSFFATNDNNNGECSLWIVNGPDVNFLGFPYPTRMVVAAVHPHDATRRGSWIWSPIPYSTKVAAAMERATGGPVRYIVSPNMIHHLFLKPWHDAFPQAALYAPPGLEGRQVVPPGLTFTGTLGSHPPLDTYGNVLDQVLFAGGGLEEVVFFHKPSSTVIFCDLIQRFPPERCCGWKGWLLKMNGLAGEHGSTPREWRFLYWIKGGLPQARKALTKVVEEWKPEKMIVAHGDCATTNATDIIQQSLSWM